MTAPASAYPRSVESLLPDAKAMTARLGNTPTRNQLMKEFRIGAPKATALIELLNAKPARRAKPTPPPAPPAGPVYTYPDPIGPVPGPMRPVIIATDEIAELSGDAPRAGLKANALKSVRFALLSQGQDPLGRHAESQVAVDGHPDTKIATAAPAATRAARRPVAWPVLLLALPAFVAIWSGWVELGELAGFGVVHPLPGIADGVKLNTAITLPIGVETYAAYALWVWLSGRAPAVARRFAKWSAIGSLIFGAAGQVAYHLMSAAGLTVAPWWITTAVACLPVAVLGMGAALAHLLHADNDQHPA
ncbi:ABC transporter permease [Asanoa iriomotensis]|uniref:ABC transporter permease n=1 Tax=Asanoa iriomotensis TaxID=234613 RepID=A0ABQ4CG53_9ACTN|nr:ABC transporter permease [Asanoa iriomotensis]GIF61747.1 ABC transporter permease [Asanoa iriomotensis]